MKRIFLGLLIIAFMAISAFAAEDYVINPESGMLDTIGMSASDISENDKRYLGTSFDFFLNDTASGVGAYFTMSSVPTGDAESTFSDTITGDAFLIDSFITTSDEPTFTTLAEGVFSLHFHANTTVGASTGTVRIYYEFYEYDDDTTETLISTSEESDVLTNSKTNYSIHCYHDETIIESDDRLLIKVYANIDNPRPTDPVASIYAEGDTSTRFTVNSDISAFDQRYLFQDGSKPLTGAWDMNNQNLANVDIDSGTVDGITSLTVANAVDIGPHFLTASGFVSDVVTGTSPYFCTSTTINTNLNADLLDGKHVGTSGNTVPLLDGANTWSGEQTFSDYITFSGNTYGVRFAEGQKLYSRAFNDISLDAPASVKLMVGGALKYVVYATNTVINQARTAGQDYYLLWGGEDNDGRITWMEDEDLFQFSDDITMLTGEKLIVGTTQWTGGASDNIDADAIEDGSTNAIPTLTQETNWDTHLSSNGSDHSYIDQDVTNGSGPTFASAVLNTAVSGTAVLDEDNLGSDSDTQIATQQSIKAYVDASSTSPGGDDTQLQYNDGGSFGGLADFTWDDTDLLIGGSSGTTKLGFGDMDTFIQQSSDGNLLIEADILVTIGVAGDIPLGDATERDMYPQTDGKINLGKIGNMFNEGHFKGILNANTAGVRTFTDDDGTISNPPTDAQLDSILGAPVSLGAGWNCFLEDTTDNDYWFIVTDGTSWYVEELTKAL